MDVFLKPDIQMVDICFNFHDGAIVKKKTMPVEIVKLSFSGNYLCNIFISIIYGQGK